MRGDMTKKENKSEEPENKEPEDIELEEICEALKSNIIMYNIMREDGRYYG